MEIGISHVSANMVFSDCEKRCVDLGLNTAHRTEIVEKQKTRRIIGYLEIVS
jgi:hypothetical protein